MPSKEEADRIAEALLEAARRKSKRSPRVPILFRTSAGNRLDRAQQWELFRAARHRVADNWPARIAIVAAPVVLMFSFAVFVRHPLTVGYVLALDGALLVPPALLVLHIRREFARLARDARQARGSE